MNDAPKCQSQPRPLTASAMSGVTVSGVAGGVTVGWMSAANEQLRFKLLVTAQPARRLHGDDIQARWTGVRVRWTPGRSPAASRRHC